MRAKWDRTKGSPEPIAALNRVLEKDNGEPLVDIRETCPSIQVLRPQVIPYLRKTVAEMLEAAGRSLREGYRLGVVECWRSYERQERIYQWHWEAMKEAHPGRSHASMRRSVNRFVAPTDQRTPPGHCTGAAVDVHLVDASGELVDVSKPFERFEAAPTYSIGLHEEARIARMMLVDAMLDAGFSNCRDEWWHYSWGDAGWAFRTVRTECVYGLIKLPLELYFE